MTMIDEFDKIKDDNEKLKNEIETLKKDYDNYTNQIEAMLQKSNSIMLESELSNIELNQILETLNDSIAVIDINYNVKRANQSLSFIVNKTPKEILNQKCSNLLSNPLCNTIDCPMKIFSKKRKSKDLKIELDLEIKLKDNQKRYFIFTATPLYGIFDEFLGIIENFKDITDRKKIENELFQANKTLELLSLIDPLTQLANRRNFEQTIDKEWKVHIRERKELSFLMCDIDNFKLYNDFYGHGKGDQCLIKIAKILSGNIYRAGDLAVRLGGEEFLLLLPNTDANGVKKIAENIQSAIHKASIDHEKSTISDIVTLSIGILTVTPEREYKIKTYLEKVDEALYKAKESGKDKIIKATIEK